MLLKRFISWPLKARANKPRLQGSFILKPFSSSIPDNAGDGRSHKLSALEKFVYNHFSGSKTKQEVPTHVSKSELSKIKSKKLIFQANCFMCLTVICAIFIIYNGRSSLKNREDGVASKVIKQHQRWDNEA